MCRNLFSIVFVFRQALRAVFRFNMKTMDDHVLAKIATVRGKYISIIEERKSGKISSI